MHKNVTEDMQQRKNNDKIYMSKNNQEQGYPVKESGNMQQKLSSANSSSETHLNQDSEKLKYKFDCLNQRHSADAVHHSRKACDEAIPRSGSHATLSNQDNTVPSMDLHGLKQTEMREGGVNLSVSSGKLIPENGNHEPKSNQVFLMPKKELDLLEERQSAVARIQTSASGEKQTDDSVSGFSQFNQVSIIPKLEKDGCDKGQIPDTGIHGSATNGGGTDTSCEKASDTSPHCQSTNTEVSASPSDQEKLTYILRPEKTMYKLQPRRNPDTGVRASQSEQASMSPRIQEKALDDGYNWRKYGQKLVKGNVFIRSYYKCTYANCLAKKQVERSYDGRLTDIKYISKHEHPKTQNSPPISAFVPPVEVRKVHMAVTAASEADVEPSVAHREISKSIEPTAVPGKSTALTSGKGEVSKSQNSHDEIDHDDHESPNAKKQRREIPDADDNLVKKTYCESRYVVQTISEVDIINDCYRWRKYGQKLVKGNPNPRSYYRCSNAGCPVKKHVERSSQDPKVVITTYEGKHDHDMPGSSSISQIEVGSDVNRKTMNGESRSENKPVGMEMAVHIGAN